MTRNLVSSANFYCRMSNARSVKARSSIGKMMTAFRIANTRPDDMVPVCVSGPGKDSQPAFKKCELELKKMDNRIFNEF